MGTGRFVDSITKKKDGGELTDEEIRQMIEGYTNDEIPDYQMSSMLMAICFQGMTEREISTMTIAMRDSGDVVDLSQIPGVKVDKHSTGGVGDKTTLIVGPIVAAYGIPVAKMSGRGLGFTGGTLDKLESIPGFRVALSEEEFFDCVKKHGISVIGQTGNLAPADKKLYALRDVTGTVSSIPLIAASIMSKKLAAGSDKILLDVTTGSGAFIKDIEGSKELAETMVSIGKNAGKETVAMITSMDEPLGYAIGNNLEVKEVISTLQGEGPEDLQEVVTSLAGMMLYLGSEEISSYEAGKEKAMELLQNGSALKKFVEFVQSQGGDTNVIQYPAQFPVAPCQGELLAKADGYITSFNTEAFGVAAGVLGAGRTTKDSSIDDTAGIILKKKIGDFVNKGEPIAELYTSDSGKIKNAVSILQDHYEIGSEKKEAMKLIVDIIC